MAPRRNRYWIWFFVLVGLLTLGAIVTLISYNLGQQLKAESVAAARKRWEAHGPANYDLFYKINHQDQNGSGEEDFVIKVRHGRVVYGTFRTSPHYKETPLQTRLYAGHDVPAFFDYLDDYLTQDAKPGAARNFMVALFDPNDGHLLHFVRRLSGASNRVEITVKEVKPASTAPLTMAALTAARNLWEQRKPHLRDYQLTYLLRQGDALHGERFWVAVRAGQLELVKCADQVISSKEPGVYDLAALFAKIADWQRADEAAQRTPAEAIFDPTNGQVRWYRRTEPAVEFLVDSVEPLAERKG